MNSGIDKVLQSCMALFVSTIDCQFSPHYNESCGLTEDEVKAITNNYLSKHSDDDRATVMRDMKLWYSGYHFCSWVHPLYIIYNGSSLIFVQRKYG